MKLLLWIVGNITLNNNIYLDLCTNQVNMLSENSLFQLIIMFDSKKPEGYLLLLSNVKNII